MDKALELNLSFMPEQVVTDLFQIKKSFHQFSLRTEHSGATVYPTDPVRNDPNHERNSRRDPIQLRHCRSSIA